MDGWTDGWIDKLIDMFINTRTHTYRERESESESIKMYRHLWVISIVIRSNLELLKKKYIWSTAYLDLV